MKYKNRVRSRIANMKVSDALFQPNFYRFGGNEVQNLKKHNFCISCLWLPCTLSGIKTQMFFKMAASVGLHLLWLNVDKRKTSWSEITIPSIWTDYVYIFRMPRIHSFANTFLMDIFLLSGLPSWLLKRWRAMKWKTCELNSRRKQ